MKCIHVTLILVLLFVSVNCGSQEAVISENNEWISIWDGESFDNWNASENPNSFIIEDGKIVVDGPRAHLFYEGPVADADFDNFEFRADVYTYPQPNLFPEY